MSIFFPATPEDVVSTVRWALGERSPLEVVGHGTKRAIGRPIKGGSVVDLSKLTGITLYEPEELVLSARAGTPLAEIEALLAGQGQELAFEPIDYGPLFGKARGAGTIGGALAANLSGPRRIKAGAARDHVLGVHAVSGRGEAFKSGGRVVKNVTGYDLSKGLAGSWGTLAVITDVTFKVLPAGQAETTLALRGLLDDVAATAMAAAMGSSAEVSAAAHLPEGIAAGVAGGGLGREPATLLRVEGFGPSVKYRSELLKRLLGSAGPIHELPAKMSKSVWRDVRDCIPFSSGRQPVWRVSVPPSRGHAFALALRMETPASAFYDWQGGLVWLRMEGEDPAAETVRSLVAAHGGGHATLVRVDPDVQASVAVFQPQPPALAALAARLKAQFDPQDILNPGRLAARQPDAD